MSRPAWTLAEAAQHCSVSRSTLKRRLSGGELPNAYKASNGQWRIPITDLIAAGYDPGKPDWGEEPAPASTTPVAPAAPSDERVRELELELAQERLRRANAEQIAEERRARIEDLQVAMRLLESPRPQGGSQAGSHGSNTWSTDLGHAPAQVDRDPGQNTSPEVRPSSPEPPQRTTDLGQGGPPELPAEPPRRGWWTRLFGG